MDLKPGNYYIINKISKDIYIGSVENKRVIKRIDLNAGRVIDYFVKGPKNLSVYKSAFLYVDTTNVYLLDGIQGIICYGRLKELNLSQVKKTSRFTLGMPISSSSYLIRGYTEKSYTLNKMMLDQDTSIVNNKLLEKQVDGLFCTDGEMAKAKGSRFFFYAYYYRNQFMCVDSNLKLIYKTNTIDTISRVNFKTRFLKAQRELTVTDPPTFVNKRLSVNERFIFIESARNSNNEPVTIVDSNAIIDVYNTTNGKYELSFYLPNVGGKKLTDFKVYDSTLVALYGQYLYTFKLNF